MRYWFFLSLLLICNTARAAETVPGELIIKFKSTTTSQSRSAALGKKKHKKKRELGNSSMLQVQVQPGESIESAIEHYRKDPNVEYVQPNYVYHLTATTPNDTHYSHLWGLQNTAQTVVAVGGGPGTVNATNNPGTSGNDMSLPQSWDLITDCRTNSAATPIVVAVLDTGVNYTHTDLTNNMWNLNGGFPNFGFDYVDNDNDPMDGHGHGTHVAGTIGAQGNNANGTTGVCWRTYIMAVRVLDNVGTGSTADIVSGLNFAVAQGAKVVNMSLGGSTYDPAFSTAITNARTSGVLVVVAAGNDGVDTGTSPSYPCNYIQDNLICVAALDQDYQLASFSNYSSTHVDVGAPGVNIVSTWPGTHATTTDPLTGGWTNGGAWGYNVALGLGGLSNPTNLDFSAQTYANMAADRTYKSFNLAGTDVAVMTTIAAYDTEGGNDFFNIGYNTGGADPFAGGTTVATLSGTSSYALRTYDVTGCIDAACTLGFELTSNATIVGMGIHVYSLQIETLTRNNVTYNVLDGTSMATPHVAGLAAMLFAYNTNYTYTDVAAAILTRGTVLSGLTSFTTTGRAANAYGSLTYVHKPVGVSAAVIKY